MLRSMCNEREVCPAKYCISWTQQDWSEKKLELRMASLFSKNQGNEMHYVYLIRSKNNSQRTYIGLTEDIAKRLVRHNSGANKHTSKFKPWELECYIAFVDRPKAAEFEKYGSGHAFAHKHFW